MLRVLTLALSLLAAEALYQPACCTSRLSLSRVTVRRAALCMCDAEEAPAAEVAAAEPVAGAAAPAEAPRPKRERAAKTPLTELAVGTEVEGKIRSVMAYGAFVDIGECHRVTSPAPSQALLPRMCQGRCGVAASPAPNKTAPRGRGRLTGAL